MTVQELFREVDFRKIGEHLANINSYFKIRKDSTEEEKQALRKIYAVRVQESAKKMLTIDAVEDPTRIIKCVWFCDPFVSASCGHKYRMDVTMHRLEDLLNKEILICDYEVEDFGYITEEEYNRKYIKSYGIGFVPWNELLGYAVASASVSAYGKEACAEAIFDEMTLFGLTQEIAEAEAKEKMREICESAKSTIEDYYTEEEVRRELSIDPLTEEEKAEYDKAFREAGKINQKEDIKITEQLIQDLKERYTHKE